MKDAIGRVVELIGDGLPYVGQSTPSVILITRAAYRQVQAKVPNLNSMTVDTFYGIPFEVFDDSEALGKRAKELYEAHKGVLILDV